MDIEKVSFGLLGEKLGHSFSPKIFNAYFRRAGRGCAYGLFPVNPKKIKTFMEGLRSSFIRGLNVTIPYKECMLSFLDEVSVDASRIGAVNVIRCSGAKIDGYNTDFVGFMRVVKPLLNPDTEDLFAVVLGAGGAARAVIYALHKLGVKDILFFGRHLQKRYKILEDFSFIPLLRGEPWMDERMRSGLKKADLVVNATPLGMFPYADGSPLPPEFAVRPGTVAFDLIYNPFDTRFLVTFRRKGAAVENGWRMLVYQAVETLKLWNGGEIDEPLFFQAAEEVRNAAFFNSR
ncbi:MAG: shikimate dehydrogenase [Candidatus Aminicenantes bacterium]|nr:shikimate dehydrogenase [Candidatus Aminicenantes bacterium]